MKLLCPSVLHKTSIICWVHCLNILEVPACHGSPLLHPSIVHWGPLSFLVFFFVLDFWGLFCFVLILLQLSLPHWHFWPYLLKHGSSLANVNSCPHTLGPHVMSSARAIDKGLPCHHPCQIFPFSLNQFWKCNSISQRAVLYRGQIRKITSIQMLHLQATKRSATLRIRAINICSSPFTIREKKRPVEGRIHPASWRHLFQEEMHCYFCTLTIKEEQLQCGVSLQWFRRAYLSPPPNGKWYFSRTF